MVVGWDKDVSRVHLPASAWESTIVLEPGTRFGSYTGELVSHRRTSPTFQSPPPPPPHAAPGSWGRDCHRHLDQQETHRGSCALLTLPASLVVIFVCPTGSEARGESSVSGGIQEAPSKP